MSRLTKSLHGLKERDEEERHDGDEFYTPSRLAGRLVGLLDLLPAQTALDPFAGTGAFYNHLEKEPNLEVDWCEIHRGRDFFKEKREFDWLVSKCTELGVDRSCPVIFERTVKQPKNPKAL